MDDSLKIFAPRPVKKNSNNRGVKIITEFEKINKINYSTYTPNAKGASESYLKKTVSEILTFDHFEKDIRDSSSTSELLSILNNESTGIDSAYLSENIISDFNDDCLLVDDLRISMPPIRCKNPFYKNFSNNKEELKYEDDYENNHEKYFDDVNIDPK
jgi:hypothetical protein